MEVDHQEQSSGSATGRPMISFPVGLALLVIMLLGITAFFFCCLYWDRLRSLLYGSNIINNLSPNSQSDHQKPHRHDHQSGKQVDEAGKSVTVLMPGDDVPKFIALVCPCPCPCPCQPPPPERIAVVVHKITES